MPVRLVIAETGGTPETMHGASCDLDGAQAVENFPLTYVPFYLTEGRQPHREPVRSSLYCGMVERGI